MKVEKYNGCGNDFVILPYDETANYAKLAIQLCQDSRFQTDGLIAVKENPLEMVFYNQDGSRAPMCGNGIRCFSNYCYRHHVTTAANFSVETLAGTMEVKQLSTEPYRCQVNLGEGFYDKEKVGFTSPKDLRRYTLPLNNGEKVLASSIFMGTVHTVVFVEDVEKELSQTRGEEICHHPYFKAQTNVNFVEIIGENALKVRTYERGVGWTLACGTGCCASYVVAKDLGYIPESKTAIHLPQGILEISGKKEITMAGPAVFEKEEEVRC